MQPVFSLASADQARGGVRRKKLGDCEANHVFRRSNRPCMRRICELQSLNLSIGTLKADPGIAEIQSSIPSVGFRLDQSQQRPELLVGAVSGLSTLENIVPRGRQDR